MAIPFKRCSPLFLERAHAWFFADLAMFLAATFLGALVAGLSGFAFGLVVTSIWLYILTPVQVAALIVTFGLIVQGYAVWKLRRAPRMARPPSRCAASPSRA